MGNRDSLSQAPNKRKSRFRMYDLENYTALLKALERPPCTNNDAKAHLYSSALASRPTKQSMFSPLSKRSGSVPEHKPAQILAEKGSPKSRGHDTPPRAQPVPAPTVPLEISGDVTKAMITPRGQKRKIQVIINHKSYLRLDCIGTGGSARVYRVMTEDSGILALKRVSLRDVDEIGVQGFKGEIDLLIKLTKVDRVVRLFDWEFNVSANHLNLVCTQWQYLICLYLYSNVL